MFRGRLVLGIGSGIGFAAGTLGTELLSTQPYPISIGVVSAV